MSSQHDSTKKPTTRKQNQDHFTARKLLLQEQIHINHVIIRDRLQNIIEQLKVKILETITPEEFQLVEKIHQNL